jgi:hypothetical protein
MLTDAVNVKMTWTICIRTLAHLTQALNDWKNGNTLQNRKTQQLKFVAKTYVQLLP